MRAYETQLEFSGAKGHAVVVEFDKPWRLIFWSKAQYVACWDLGKGVWFTPEWLETGSPEDFHCWEPIMDKKLKYSRVSILESGPARAKILWHYACNNLRYEVFNGNTTADEYYTVYPDGVAVRKLVAYPGDKSSVGGNPKFWQVLEYILVNERGTTPDSTLNKEEAFTLQNEKGDKIGIPWPLPDKPFRPLCADYPEIADWDMYIGRVHLKDRPDPYVIFAKDQRIFPYKRCIHCNRDHPYFGVFEPPDIFVHWPATDMEDFMGAYMDLDSAGKVATHSSFIACKYTSILADRPARGTSWLFLTGATEKPSSYLTELAKSWYYPADVQTGNENKTRFRWARGNTLFEGYRYSERAYSFRKFGVDKIEFSMKPQVPVINPVFMVNGWETDSAKILLNGKPVNSDRVRAQITGDDLLLWMDEVIDNETEVVISEK